MPKKKTLHLNLKKLKQEQNGKELLSFVILHNQQKPVNHSKITAECGQLFYN